MLVNGKEVFTDDYELTSLQAYNVQQKINAVPEMDNAEKSDAVVNSGAIESSQRGSGSNQVQNFSIGMFETLGSTTAKRTLRTREQLYETYIRMSGLGLVKRALDTIADEASQSNDDNDVIKVNSNNEKIYNCLQTLFFDKLSINTELWSIIVETLKMGDNFYEVSLEVKDGMATGIKRLKYLDPSKVEIHEKDGRVDYYVYKTQTKSKNMSLEQRLFPWQIVHFKIEDKESKPYGKSLLYAGIRSYERLTATEDIFLTYTISRTPSRRVFKIDVGGLPPLEAQRAIREMRDSYRAQSVIDSNGNLNQISSILSITSDIFIPVREGQGTTIETLQGDSMNMNQNMVFLQNFKNDLIASFNIPAEYLGVEGVGDARSTTLSQKDIKFGRFVERIQQQILKTFYKIATIELFFNGFKGDDLKDFIIELTPPSTTKEITENGLLNEKINLLQTMQSLNVFPTNWLLKKILKLSDKEVAEIQFMKMIESRNQQMLDQQAQMGGMQGGMMPMGASPELDFGGSAEVGNEVPSEGGEEIPAAEGGEEIPAAPEGSEPGVEMQGVSFLNVDGQKFLIEDKEDFLEIVKYVKFQNENRNAKSSEFMEGVNDYGERKPQVKSSNPFFFLNENNEFGGLDIRKGTNFKRYSGKLIKEEVTRN